MKNLDQVKKTVKAILESVAADLECEPGDVTVTDFWSRCGGKITEWQLRKIGGFNAVKRQIYPARITAADINKQSGKNEISKGRHQQDVAVSNEALKTMIQELSASVFKGRVKPVKTPKGSKETKRVVNIVLSDLHIGADVKKSETGFQDFGRVEESRRLAAIVQQVCSYKIQYRKQSTLAVHLIGDIIQGVLHDPRDGAPQAEQFARALHILSQAFAHLSAAFPRVDVYCSPGNHGRNTARHKERAVHQKWDAIETMLYYSIKSACHFLKNVHFHIPMTPFSKPEILGVKMFSTHGDTVLKAGQPNKSLQMGALENQINKINASLPDAEEHKVFIMGHVHIPAMVHLDNGSVVVTNGCMVPTDAFSVSLGNLENHCGQWIWETTSSHPVGDARLVKIGRREDLDESLDQIIKPWESFS